MIDCVSSAPAFMLGTRAFEKASHLIDLPIAFLTGATVVRKDVWERIAPDVRARLLEIAHDVGARIDADAKRLESDALSAMASQGLTKVPVSADEWRPSMEKSWEVIRGEAVPAPFFDEVKAARDACRSASSAAARTPPRGAPRPPARGR
jgi:TRAP-type C4-dicarboxylate transport system substrate-binding protein